MDRSNKPPVWEQTVYGPIYVKENTAIGETVTTVIARSVWVCYSTARFAAVQRAELQPTHG